MSITFDPRASNTATSVTSEFSHPQVERSGLPGIASSIEWQIQAHEVEGGCFSWLNDLIRWICSCCSSTATSISSVTPANLLEDRVAVGNGFLDTLFNRNDIVNANGANQAIVVLLHFDGRTIVSYERASVQKNRLADIKGQLRQLLTRVVHAPNDNRTLRVETMLFKKNQPTSFDYCYEDLSVNFGEGRNGNGRGRSDGASLRDIMGIIETTVCSREEKRRIFDFINHL